MKMDEDWCTLNGLISRDEATQKYLDFMPTFQWHDDLQHLQHRLVMQGHAKHDHVLIRAESLF